MRVLTEHSGEIQPVIQHEGLRPGSPRLARLARLGQGLTAFRFNP